ncbi:MAG: hypothetical protein Q9222_002800 [Ikaeria aurantiellina]
MDFASQGHVSIFARRGRVNDTDTSKNRMLSPDKYRCLAHYYWRGNHRPTGIQPRHQQKCLTLSTTLRRFSITSIVAKAKRVPDVPRTMHVLALPDQDSPDSSVLSYRVYPAFVHLSDTDFSMRCFDVNERFNIKFPEPTPDYEDPEDNEDDESEKVTSEPDEVGQEKLASRNEKTDEEGPAGQNEEIRREKVKKASQLWSAHILPQVPQFDAAPGNLTFILKRPKGDPQRQLKLNDEVKLNMISEEVYFLPMNSDRSA